MHRVKQGVETINFSKICISWTRLKQSTQFATLGCPALLTQTPGTPCFGRFSCDVRSQLQRFPSTLGQPSPEHNLPVQAWGLVGVGGCWDGGGGVWGLECGGCWGGGIGIVGVGCENVGVLPYWEYWGVGVGDIGVGV